jgi:hypothetical protein
MWRKIIAVVLALTVPAAASAGSLKDAVAKAGRDIAAQSKETQTRSRTRFWTSIALIGGGATLATLGGVELGDDESGPDDGEDMDDSDDGEDSDGWSQKAMIGGGIAAAALGTVLLITGRQKGTGQQKSGPVLSVGPKGVAVRHTVRF